MLHRRAALLATAAALLAPASRARGQAAAREKVRLALNPSVYRPYLPLFLAVDKGYFAEAGVEIELTRYNGSSTSQLPLLARGDIDIAPAVGSAAFFNQYSEGFRLRLITALISPRAGWHDSTWVLVRKALWDASAVRAPADLRGRMVDGGADGSPSMFLTNQALSAGGLTPADVRYTERFRTPPDFLAAFRNGAADVLSAPEPVAAQLEAEGLAHRWLSARDLAPWFQETFLAASPTFLERRRPVARNFLMAYLKGAAEVTACNGQWTPELRQTVSRWSGVPDLHLSLIDGPVYPGDRGEIDTELLARQQQYWVAQGKVRSPVAITEITDTTILRDARQAMGL